MDEQTLNSLIEKTNAMLKQYGEGALKEVDLEILQEHLSDELLSDLSKQAIFRNTYIIVKYRVLTDNREAFNWRSFEELSVGRGFIFPPYTFTLPSEPKKGEPPIIVCGSV